MRIGGFRRFEDFLIHKWYITAPLALLPVLVFTSIGVHITDQPSYAISGKQISSEADPDNSGITSSNDKKNDPKSVKGAVDTRVTNCRNGQPTTPGLADATNLIIRKLSEYEELCKGAVTDTLMVFTGMPTSATSAKSMAADMTATLKEFSKYGLTPLVVMEPTTQSGTIDFVAFSNGEYDAAFKTYFQSLKSSGITDSTMGIWSPFPECNIPEWGPTNPSQFRTNFKKAATIQKEIFPDSKITMILDSLSYPPGEMDWDGGSYVSLSPYIKGIPKGLVDSFGYQGFPWASPANEPNFSNHDAAKFLKPSLAKEAAELLGTKHIWLNTGTYKTFYGSNLTKRVAISSSARAEILSDITSQAKWLKDKGFKVAVSLFAENKSGTGEDVDWSYWSGTKPTGSHSTLLKNFIAGLQTKSIDFWLFDSL